ncbi:sugar ABC transporter substrate-binding protein [Pseudonocardiaceae bacterium YIM PH 21723]|nr:sugar ABC transporter substrate-binding protein [Pseudonocardiaceae bacterium YIM PH 21723]
MRRTRVAAVLVALLSAVLVLTACQGGAKGGDHTLSFIPGTKGEPFYISMQCGAQAKAAELGYTLDPQPPDKFDPSLQTPIVSAVTAAKPGAILIAPTSPVAMGAPLKEAKRAGIPIVEVDTALKDRSVAVSSVSSDNPKGGGLGADALAKLVGEKGPVLIIDTTAGTSTTNARARGFAEQLKKYPEMKNLGTQYNENEASKAATIVTATLAAHPDLAGIFATNLSSTEGAATGLRNAGKTGQVKLIGFDASPKQVADMKAGAIQALIAQDPAAIGASGVQQAVNALQGKPVERTLLPDMVTITADDQATLAKYAYKTKC